MTSTFFTTDDGDVILRAGSEPGPKYDFRVHKFILSLASPIFKDIFALPQPPTNTSSEQHQPPVIDIQEPPEVLDIILRFVYPGVELPKIGDQSTIITLLSAADKYNIASMYPTLRENLKASLSPRGGGFLAYVAACRFGFPEVIKEAARVSTTRSLTYARNPEDVQQISSADLLRLVQFVITRESEGLSRIAEILDQPYLEDITKCSHSGEDAQDYYFHLEKEVGRAFVDDPCIGSRDLFALLDRINDPPTGCDPPPKSAEWYFEGGDENAFGCPLQPMTIRRRLSEIAEILAHTNKEMLKKFFGQNSRNG